MESPKLTKQYQNLDSLGDCPSRKDEKNANELLGLKLGTACPAPLNVAYVSPSYS